MESHNHHSQNSSTSTSSPKQQQQRTHRRSKTQTTQASSAAEWLRLEVSPLVSKTRTGSDGIPMLGHSVSFPMDVSNANPADSKNKGNGIDDGSGSRSRTVEQLQEQFSDLATHADVNDNGNINVTSDQQSDDEEYLELRGGLLELQKLQELQNPFCYDGIEVKAGDDESEEADIINNTSMEVVADFAPVQPQQRKGMVRREFGRRVMRFKKKIYNNKDDNNNSNKEPIPDLGGSNTNDDDSDNNVGLGVKDLVVKPSKMKMGINKAMHSYSPFAASNYYNKSKMMTMVSGQDNGC